MELKNKTLLLMGGGAYVKGIKSTKMKKDSELLLLAEMQIHLLLK